MHESHDPGPVLQCSACGNRDHYPGYKAGDLAPCTGCEETTIHVAMLLTREELESIETQTMSVGCSDWNARKLLDHGKHALEAVEAAARLLTPVHHRSEEGIASTDDWVDARTEWQSAYGDPKLAEEMRKETDAVRAVRSR